MTTVDAVQTTRFGAIEIAPQDIITFPGGLIGLPGTDYVLLEATGPFQWLQSLTDGSLALPLTDPLAFFAGFRLDPADDEVVGPEDRILVTVRATPDPSACTANLRAPILITGGQARQVVNLWPEASVRAPLFGPGRTGN